MALDAVYLLGLVVAEGLRLPRRLTRASSRRSRRRPGGSIAPRELLVMSGVVIGIWLLPLAYMFTPWLDAFDFAPPPWTAWPASAVFAVSLVVRWAGQSALGAAWSPTGEATDGNALVTSGIYSQIRHPLYASMLLWGVAQPFLLPNVLAGFGGLVAAALIWMVRVPAEERMLLDAFGQEYADYARATGALIPQVRR